MEKGGVREKERWTLGKWAGPTTVHNKRKEGKKVSAKRGNTAGSEKRFLAKTWDGYTKRGWEGK